MLVSRFTLGKPINDIIENFVSGSHFLTKPLDKMLARNLTPFLAVSTNSLWISDGILMPTHAHVRSSESLRHVTLQESQAQGQASRDPSVHGVL